MTINCQCLLYVCVETEKSHKIYMLSKLNNIKHNFIKILTHELMVVSGTLCFHHVTFVVRNF